MGFCTLPLLLVLIGSTLSEETNQSKVTQLLQRLHIEADASLPGFKGDMAVLFQAGATHKQFSCDSPEASAEEPAEIAFRRLKLSVVEAELGMSSVFGGWLGDTAAVGPVAPAKLYVLEAKVTVISNDSALPLLNAALDSLESNSPLEISEADQLNHDVTILYDCWQRGLARVELRLQISATAEADPRPDSTEVCLTWRKTCAVGFHTLKVHHGQSQLYPSAGVAASVPLLAAEGTSEEVTKLRFTTSGALRLKPPRVSSSSNLKVDLRGFSAGEAIEVTAGDSMEISIVYSCLGVGLFDVTLALEPAVLSAAHASEVLQLKWSKNCGDSVYRFLDVFLKQEKNRTQVVSKGQTLPGFVQCPKMTQEFGPGTVDGTQATEKCSLEASETLEIAPKDLRTSIELRLDDGSSGHPPALQPPPDLSFDKKILRAYIMQPGTENFRTQKAISPTLSRAASTHMMVRYSCHRAGVSLIVVTIYVAQHKPIDFAWRKRCAEPKVHTSKALTAPQAMTFAFLVCGGIGMVVCMICLFCSSDQDKNQLFKGPPTVRTKKGSRDIDFWQVPDSQKVGYEYEEEVIYHTGRT